MFQNKYGKFSNDGKEYIITTPRTPRPWSNIMTNGDYGCIVSQTGSGYSWKTNAQLNRITRWEQDLIKDEWGKYLYIRDDESKKIWSAGWKPVCVEPESYEVRHGIGYTIITSVNEGIKSELQMFVPRDASVELWKLTLTNLQQIPRSLSLFTFFEWNLGAAPDWHREFHKCFIHTEYDPSLGTIWGTKRLWEVPSDDGHWNRNWEYVAFHSVSKTPVGFDCDKESFMGMYGSQRLPASVVDGALKGQSGNSLDAMASLHVKVALKPGESETVTFSLGAEENSSKAEKIIKRFHSLEAVDQSFKETAAWWDSMMNVMQVNTPDDSMNIMLNTWLKYQAIAGRLWGRTGYYQTGGAYGFRDQLQDSQIFLHSAPEQTANQLLLHARHQFKDGTVYHWWHPLSERGLPTDMTDDLLWLPYVLGLYLEETGEYNILKSKEPFLDDKKPSTLYDHSIRAIEKVLKRVSKRGIPLIGAGDWNDGLSAVGLQWKGESIWLGQFLHRILIDFSIIADHVKDKSRAKRYRSISAKLKKAINKHGWDKEYYFGATKDSGEKLGSKGNKEGKIWLNTQTWGVLSDVAEKERAEQVMNVVEQSLEFDAGTVLLHPGFSIPDPKIGYLTRYASGMRENGGTYTHAATWTVIAHAKLKRAEAAYRSFSKINPIVRSMEPDRYTAEPYVTPGNIDGPNSRFYGRGGWTWYTGSAAWLFKAGTDWILGIRASRNGLIVDPCIPKEWDGYSVKRLFRGSTYEIIVKNPDHVSMGVMKACMNGKELDVEEGKVILPISKTKSQHSIEVIMGKMK